jgi:phosphatidylglycerophosphate synthase
MLSTIVALQTWAARKLVAAGLTPDFITFVSLALGLGSGVAFATSALVAGGLMVLVGGILDALDGAMARDAGTRSARGAFFDSVCDRYAEVAAFGGLAIHYAGSPAMLAIILAALTGAYMTSYARARGEALGVTVAEVGLVQRPQRVLLVGGAALFGSVTLVPGLGLVALLGNVTALVRIRHVQRALAAARAPAPGPVVEPELPASAELSAGLWAGASRDPDRSVSSPPR